MIRKKILNFKRRIDRHLNREMKILLAIRTLEPTTEELEYLLKALAVHPHVVNMPSAESLQAASKRLQEIRNK